ncbi:hypothetical protein HISP_06395 [Haloarcula hispanica N601]|uniref:Doxx family protein n=3 Tax=Haloarcula hispanica TaxID=51589 RepID=A0A482T0Z9_HALHI|nr:MULTISPECIES: hypothetical protein [Haloarcula]AHB67460.1 hypothetical protein HISP_06395 [Haloarcula hispanica N601]AJF26775.1 hypothetical protein SG26_14045 [Haloarcula sp. CBA1115]KAA9407395.1 hypothetical protein Har1131_11470 [Haloarcula sp. CBA1131]KAA9409561.1 hypothetical protein EGO51_07025 [Haloarcula hispanica]KZX48352.1 hypothetical protein AV929_05140 [Haloarcula sp. K1]
MGEVQSQTGGGLSPLRFMVQKYNEVIDRVVEGILVPYGTRIAFLTYAFVFSYYGFLKVQALFSGLSTPVRGEVHAVVTILGLPELGISLTAVMVFIGVYELTIGLLFLLQKIRAIFFLFLGHQFVTLATLVIARSAYFQEPFLLGTVPWLFDAFAAYILKNTIFIGGFLVLAAVELGQGSPEAATAKSAKMESAVSTD